MKYLSSMPLAALLSFALLACGGAQTAEPAHTPDGHKTETAVTPQGAVKVAPGDAKPGDTTTCPVSGEEFVVDASSPHVERDGKTYYFCCGGCKKKFEGDPAKFTGPKT